MFLDFFYALRKHGLDVSVGEWMTLMEGMEKGLHRSSFSGFYFLARAIVVKSEAEFDKFDQTFAEVFKDVPYEGPVPDEVMQWLLHPKEDLQSDLQELMMRTGGHDGTGGGGHAKLLFHFLDQIIKLKDGHGFDRRNNLLTSHRNFPPIYMLCCWFQAAITLRRPASCAAPRSGIRTWTQRSSCCP